jgi:hypothetical protein
MKSDPLLTQIGLQELNERGYINIKDTSINQSFKDCQDDEIHPVFLRGRWSQRDLATTNWEAFRPTLRLASHLLQCDTTIQYLFGISDQANYGTIDPKYRRPGSNPNWFHIPDYVSVQNEFSTYAALNDLAPGVTWSVTDPSKDPYFNGITHLIYLPVDPLLVGMPDLRTTSILITNDIVDILCRGVPPSSFAENWNPGTDDESARLRCSVLCATVMVHEVMHAFGIVQGNWPHHGHSTSPPEPFYVDSRVAELGD